jgi:hypothetical protein
MSKIIGIDLGTTGFAVSAGGVTLNDDARVPSLKGVSRQKVRFGNIWNPTRSFAKSVMEPTGGVEPPTC